MHNSIVNTPKLTIAVIFGGASSEHDVSVVSAQQLMDAVDPRRFNILPVYLDFENQFWTGETLRNITTFRPQPSQLKKISFIWGDCGSAFKFDEKLQTLHKVDCILPVLHGPFGEDGRIQGYFELMGIPCTGFSASNSTISMRKDITKTIVKEQNVNVLPHIKVGNDYSSKIDAIKDNIKNTFGFPVVVKPANLGSSIGVGIANDETELVELIAFVLTKDCLALIEPKVKNLVEYNIAVRNDDGKIMFSAIEKPKSNSDLLDFREKYLSNGGGTKGAYMPSEGMLSLTREINPILPESLKNKIYEYALNAFIALGGRGAPRIDFLCDSKTNELWFNEINSIPGSYGFFLWEAASNPLTFPELIHHLVSEARETSLKEFDDPVPQDAYLLQR